jgi:hypothetical protein
MDDFGSRTTNGMLSSEKVLIPSLFVQCLMFIMVSLKVVQLRTSSDTLGLCRNKVVPAFGISKRVPTKGSLLHIPHLVYAVQDLNFQNVNIGLAICVEQTLLSLFVGNTDGVSTEGDVKLRRVDVDIKVETLPNLSILHKT